MHTYISNSNILTFENGWLPKAKIVCPDLADMQIFELKENVSFAKLFKPAHNSLDRMFKAKKQRYNSRDTVPLIKISCLI